MVAPLEIFESHFCRKRNDGGPGGFPTPIQQLDAFVISDTYVISQPVITGILNESIHLIDGVNRPPTPVSLSETIHFIDELNGTIHVLVEASVDETLDFTDTYSTGVIGLLAETFAVNDSHTTTIKSLLPWEPIRLSNQTYPGTDYDTLVVESIAFDDIVQSVTTKARLMETLAVTNTQTTNISVLKDETITLIDTPKGSFKAIQVAETFALIETPKQIATGSVAESINLSDVVSQKQKTNTPNDALLFTDTYKAKIKNVNQQNTLILPTETIIKKYPAFYNEVLGFLDEGDNANHPKHTESFAIGQSFGYVTGDFVGYTSDTWNRADYNVPAVDNTNGTVISENAYNLRHRAHFFPMGKLSNDFIPPYHNAVPGAVYPEIYWSELAGTDSRLPYAARLKDNQFELPHPSNEVAPYSVFSLSVTNAIGFAYDSLLNAGYIYVRLTRPAGTRVGVVFGLNDYLPGSVHGAADLRVFMEGPGNMLYAYKNWVRVGSGASTKWTLGSATYSGSTVNYGSTTLEFWINLDAGLIRLISVGTAASGSPLRTRFPNFPGTELENFLPLNWRYFGIIRTNPNTVTDFSGTYTALNNVKIDSFYLSKDLPVLNTPGQPTFPISL